MISVASPETQTQISVQTHSPEKSSPEEFIFRSKLSTIDLSNHLPLHTYCFQNASKVSEEPCLINGANGKIYTYAETQLMCKKVGSGLYKHGIRKGDVIMILLQNSPEFVFTFMGASMIGSIVTTANPFYTQAEIFKQFSISRAKMIITQSQYVDKLRREEPPLIGSDFTVFTVDNPPENCLPFSILSDSDENEIPSVTIDSDEPVALPFSSGTTGLPKGVILTHKSLVSSIAQQVDGENPNLYLKTEDVLLCVLPLFHIFSLNSVLLCSLRAGAKVLLMQKFEIVTLLELIQKFEVSVAAVVPPLVLALAKNNMVEKYDLSSIRIVLSGAAPLGKDLLEALKARLPQAIFGQGYGMTEAGPVLSMCPAFAKEPFPTKSGSCGTVVRNAELKVIDSSTGFSLPRNQPGEICIRGPQIMKGYLNDEEATKMTIDLDGWLHTGDIGFVDDDDEIFIVDRVKELVKFKGFQVPPAELEGFLINHPSIADAAVVPKKDEEAGEVPVAFVVRSPGSEISEEEIKEYIAKQVVFYKRLHEVHFIHAIPKSPSGKILRRDLRDKLVENSSSS